MKTTKKIGVIGSGLGGLAAACTLASRGHSVMLFDKNNWLGGKAAVLEEKGFKFDMGPTILMMPSVLQRIFKEAGKNLKDYIELIKLEPQWRCFFSDGNQLDLSENVNKMAEHLDKFSSVKDPGRSYQTFMEMSSKLNRISREYYFYKPISGIGDLIKQKSIFNPKLLKDLLFGTAMGKSAAETIRRFNQDPRIAQMVDHFCQYVGSSPYKSPAVLCGIAHMQSEEGVWYPMGGIGKVPEALTQLVQELGVEIHRDTMVDRIIIENGRVTGVKIKDETIELQALISNCDTVRTHRELIPQQYNKPFLKRRKYEPACSGVVLYLGLDKQFEHLAHHDFVFSQDPHEEFEWIYKKGEPAPDPTCYLAVTTRTEQNNAPNGCESLYVLVHTPYLRPHHDWQKLFPKYRKTILNKLEKTAKIKNIESHIIYEKALTPQDIHTRYHVLNGAIYGLSSHGKLLGAFKPNNRSHDIKGLYFAGGSAHPGPGMPMVLMSGWIAADILDKDISHKSTKVQPVSEMIAQN